MKLIVCNNHVATGIKIKSFIFKHTKLCIQRDQKMADDTLRQDPYTREGESYILRAVLSTDASLSAKFA